MLSAFLAQSPPTPAADLDPAWISALIALVVAVFGCIAWCTRWAWRILRQVGHFLDDWRGEEARDGLPTRPGVMSRLVSVETLVAQVHAETRPNHGSSLRDVVNQTAADVAGIKKEQAAVRADLDQVRPPHAGSQEAP